MTTEICGEPGEANIVEVHRAQVAKKEHQAVSKAAGVKEYGDQRSCDLARKRLFTTLLKAVSVKGVAIQDSQRTQSDCSNWHVQ